MKVSKSIALSLSVVALSFCWFAQAQAAPSGVKAASKERPSSRLKLRHSFTSTGKRRAQKFRLKAIKDIRPLLKETKDPSKRYELLRRLGELYVEQAEYSYEIEIAKYERDYRKWERRGNKKQKEPEMVNLISDKSRKQAVRIYKHIVEKFKDYPQVDISYFELGKTYLRLDQDKGVDYLMLLLKEHPKSVLVPETYLALGERFFDKHNIPKAKSYYQKALKFRSHQIYPYVVYKLGWTHYNSSASTPEGEKKNLLRTLASFKLVVKLADQAKNRNSSLFLRQEAINDLVVVWADLGDVDGAYKYFRSIGSTESFYLMLERLGNIYTEQGKYPLAIKVYKRLLKEAPLRDSSPTSHAKLVDLYDKTGNVSKLQASLVKMTNLYLPGGKWERAIGRDVKKKGLVNEAKEKVEKSVHRYAKLFHQRGQKQKSKKHYNVGAGLYVLFLKKFEKSKDAYEIRYLLADALYEMKEYDRAATQYSKVVALGKKDGKYTHDAALNAVACMTNVVSKEKYPAIAKQGTLKKPATIPASKEKFIKTLDTYVKLYPRKKQSKRMFLTSARIMYDYGHYDRAIKRFVNITQKIPGSDQSNESVSRVLNHYEDRKDWDTVIVYTKKFLGQKKLLTGKLRDKTQKLLIDASFERAIAFTKERKYDKAAAAFMAFQKDFPKEKNAPNALYNAMVNYFRHGDSKMATVAATTLLKNYGAFDKKRETIIALADTYQNLATFGLAASYYGLYAKNWPKDKKSPRALFNAAILYKGVGQSDKAVVHFERYLATYPNHSLSNQAHKELVELFEAKKDVGRANELYRAIAKKFKKSHPSDAVWAEVKLAVYDHRRRPTKTSQASIKRLARKLARKGAPSAIEARKLLAQTYFVDLDKKYLAYKNAPIDTSKGIEKGISAKQQVLKSIASQYETILDIGDGGYTVASLYRIGDAHEVFAKAMNTMKLPAGLPKEEVTLIRKQVADAARPLSDQAYQYFLTAYQRGTEAKVFSPWVETVQNKLAITKPSKHHRVREFQVEPGYMAHSLSYDGSVASSFN